MGDLSLDEAPTDGTLSLDSGTTATLLPTPEVAARRAMKAHIGLGGLSPGFDNLQSGIASGMEFDLRHQASAKEMDRAIRERGPLLAQVAQKLGGNATPQDKEIVSAIANHTPQSDPNTVFERNFGRSYISLIAGHNEQTQAALQENSRETHRSMDAASELVAKQELFRKGVEDVTAETKVMPTSDYILNTVDQLIPFMSSLRMHNIAVPGSILPGNNLEDQVHALWALPIEEAKKRYDSAILALKGLNPLDALLFAHAVNNYSNQDTIGGNLMGIADATIIGGIGAKVVRKLSGGEAFRGAMRDAVKANAGGSLSDTLTAVGETEKAAQLKAVKILSPKGSDPLMMGAEIRETIPSFYNPSVIGINKGANSTELSNRIIGKLTQSAQTLQGALAEAPRINRLPADKLQEGIAAATVRAKAEFPAMNDGILDVRHVHVPESNTDWVNVRVGKLPPTMSPAPQPPKLNIKTTTVTEATQARSTQALWPHAVTEPPPKTALWMHDDLPNRPIGEMKSPLWQHNIQEEGPSKKTISTIEPNKGALWQYEVQTILGKRDATLFKNPQEAQTYAEQIYGITNSERYTIQQEGKGWFISLPTAVREMSDGVRAVPLATDNKLETPSLIASVLRPLFDPEKMPGFQRQNRMIAQHTPVGILDAVSDIMKQNLSLKKAEHKELTRVLEYQRDFEDYSKPMSRGKYSNSFSDLQRDWKTVTGKLPSEAQQLAYFQIKQLNDLDWTIRNFNYHRDAAIRGVEHVSIPMPDGFGRTKPVMGILRDEYPLNKAEDAGILWYDKGTYRPYFFQSDLTDEQRKMLKAQWKNDGLKIIQLWNPDDRPLSGVFGKDPIHYIITKDYDTKPLPFKLIDYNPGGHVIYPNQWKTVQPMIETGRKGKDFFYGDKVITGHETEAQAREWAGRQEQVRQLINKHGFDHPIVKDYIDKNIPADFEIIKQFKQKYLSLDHPIVHIPFGPSTTSLNTHATLREQYPEAKLWNLLQSSHNPSSGVDKSFMAERNGPLMSMVNTGSKSAPLYEMQPARVLDPLLATERGIQNSIHRGMFMNDYKISAVEQWVQQNAPLLNVKGGIDELRVNPLHHFHNPQYVPKNAINSNALRTAEQSRTSIKNFLGVQSELTKDLNIIQEKVGGWLYKHLGDKSANWFSANKLSVIKEPSDYIRGVNTFFQFAFSPVQLLVQGVSVTHSLAVSPAHGMQGFAAAMAHRLLAFTERPNIHKYVAKLFSDDALQSFFTKNAGVAGWKAEHFSESSEALRRSGFMKIGGEVAWRDALEEPRIMQTVGDKISAIGYMPFREGDRIARMTAWHTAYHEWRAVNPTEKLDNRAMGGLLLRAQTLSVDMTREASTQAQHGLTSIPLQFWSFSMRFAEQFYGSRLTTKEKASALMVYSALFGVPITLSGTGVPGLIPGGIYPYYEGIKTALMENFGKEVMDSEALQLFHEGLIGRIVAWSTGQEYDVSHRLGPGARDTVKVLINTLMGTDTGQSVLSLVMGPSGSTLEKLAKNTLPLYAGIRAALRGDQNTFPLTNEDIINVAKEFAAARQGYNAFMAWNYQKYVAQNASIVANDMTKTDAVMAALGITRMDISDSRLMQQSMKTQKDYQDWVSQQMLEQFKRAWMAGGQNEWGDMEKYMARAKTFGRVFGDMNENQMTDVFKRSMSNELLPTIDKINRDFHDPRKAPQSQSLRRMMGHFGIGQ